MFRLKLVPDNSAFDFLCQMRLTAAFSVMLVLVSIGLFFGKGPNSGIDFRGILTEAQSQNAVEVANSLRSQPFALVIFQFRALEVNGYSDPSAASGRMKQRR